MPETQLFETMYCATCKQYIPIGDWVNHCDDHAAEQDDA